MASKLKLAFIGCGGIARYHLDGIKEHAPQIDVTAAIDLDEEKANAYAAETGATAFTSLEEALEKGDFEAVDIMLPHDLHETVAAQCFDAGKHVLLEKPMALDLASCDRILGAAKDAGTVFMVAENSQYWPEIVKAKEVIENGAIGDIITARAAFCFPFYAYWFQGDHPWRYDEKRVGGGVTIDGGSHWIRPLRMWMGEIEEAIGVLDYPMAEMKGESLMRGLLRFQSGKTASLDAMMIDTVFAPDAWWRVTGTKGELTIDSGLTGVLRLFDKDHPDGRVLMEPRGYAQSFGPELADFAASVLDGKSLEAAPEHALGELRTALAIYRSAETGTWEKVW